jgi:hypothetical protein
MKRSSMVFAFALLAAACKLDVLNPPVDGGGGGVLPQVDLSVLGPGATKLLADVGNAKLELDPTHRDALTGLGACADLISYCYAPGSKDLKACFTSAPKCTTTEPWNEQACCPQACSDAFDAEVASGTAPVSALEKVLFREPDCFPGARALLEAP